jgi:hypothetical protein
MNSAEHDFMFEGMGVGVFQELPASPGLFRYEPYRGPGHYEMQERLKAGENPRCYYDSKGMRISFTVTRCPEYGVLELLDFESSQLKV